MCSKCIIIGTTILYNIIKHKTAQFLSCNATRNSMHCICILQLVLNKIKCNLNYKHIIKPTLHITYRTHSKYTLYCIYYGLNNILIEHYFHEDNQPIITDSFIFIVTNNRDIYQQ